MVKAHDMKVSGRTLDGGECTIPNLSPLRGDERQTRTINGNGQPIVLAR